MPFGIVLFSNPDGSSFSIVASRFFTPEGNDCLKRDRELAVMQRAVEDFRFASLCADSHGASPAAASTPAPLAGGPSSSSIIDEIGEIIGGAVPAERATSVAHGSFSVLAGALFSQPKSVVWRQIGGGKFFTAMICERHENLALARAFLDAFMALRDFSALTAERIFDLWQTHLPNGQLTFYLPKST